MRPPVAKAAWNRITPKEEVAIVEVGRDERLCDFRAAGLMVYGHDTGKFHCSVSTVQRVLIRNRLQAPYAVPTRKRPVKPDIRSLMNEPKKVFSYDATEFYLTPSRLRVVVIAILDLGSRKFIHYGVRVTSFTQQDVMDIWDEALWKEGIDTKQLTALSDRGGQMKGSRTKAHLVGKWDIRLEFARPYTPDDNAWIEALIKYMKYHPACPDDFETVQDVINWVEKFYGLYNDHPHSALGYVRPNDEHAGLGNTIRTQRKENLLIARKVRLGYYHSQKAGVAEYGLGEDRGSDGIVDENFGAGKTENEVKAKNGALEALQGEVFNTTPQTFCVKIAD
jgi:putative transposase